MPSFDEKMAAAKKTRWKNYAGEEEKESKFEKRMKLRAQYPGNQHEKTLFSMKRKPK